VQGNEQGYEQGYDEIIGNIRTGSTQLMFVFDVIEVLCQSRDSLH
jgi:hypothetical protein